MSLYFSTLASFLQILKIIKRKNTKWVSLDSNILILIGTLSIII
jgi:uncharacterized protein with PQ loop repeat